MMNLEDYAGKNIVVDAGTYEVVIINATKKQSKNGTTDYLNISFKIRDDVDQKYKNDNVCLFQKFFRDKTNAEWFDLKQSGSLLKTQMNTPNYQTKFEEVDEFIQYINGITLALDVEKVYDDYWGQDVNRINFVSWRSPYHETKFGAYTKKESTVKEAQNLDSVDATEEDLPF